MPDIGDFGLIGDWQGKRDQSPCVVSEKAKDYR